MVVWNHELGIVTPRPRTSQAGCLAGSNDSLVPLHVCIEHKPAFQFRVENLDNTIVSEAKANTFARLRTTQDMQAVYDLLGKTEAFRDKVPTSVHSGVRVGNVDEHWLVVHPDGVYCPERIGCSTCTHELSKEMSISPGCSLEDVSAGLLFTHGCVIWVDNQPVARFTCPCRRRRRMALCVSNPRDGVWVHFVANAACARKRVGTPPVACELPYSIKPPPVDDEQYWNCSPEAEKSSFNNFSKRHSGTVTDWNLDPKASANKGKTSGPVSPANKSPQSKPNLSAKHDKKRKGSTIRGQTKTSKISHVERKSENSASESLEESGDEEGSERDDGVTGSERKETKQEKFLSCKRCDYRCRRRCDLTRHQKKHEETRGKKRQLNPPTKGPVKKSSTVLIV